MDQRSITLSSPPAVFYSARALTELTYLTLRVIPGWPIFTYLALHRLTCPELNWFINLGVPWFLKLSHYYFYADKYKKNI
jgi:ABC-type transport system involved in cytochrome c biogenesis permease subunit